MIYNVELDSHGEDFELDVKKMDVLKELGKEKMC